MAFKCPWPCVADHSPSSPIVIAPPKSFAAALGARTLHSHDEAPYPIPCMKGDALSIKIGHEEYTKGLAEVQNALRGRLTLSKGDKPYTARDVVTKLGSIWKLVNKWKMVPLGRGYYDFHFDHPDDLRRIWAAGTINLKPGLLRLSQWTKDFNHYSQKQTHASIWIRLVELPQEYWRERTLKEIASAVGTPIEVDAPTRNRAFGHYARILVDIDLSKHVYDEILVEREGFAFKVEVQYERRPLFCHHCYVIGHNVVNCKWLHPEAARDKDNGKKPTEAEQTTHNIRQNRNYKGASTSTLGTKGTSLQYVAVTAPPTAPVGINQVQPVLAVVPTTEIQSNSFSFALQNVSDEIPQGRLPQPDIPVLELALDVEHDDVQPLEKEQTQQDVPSSVVAVPVPIFVEHVDVHDDLASDILVTDIEDSPLPTNNISHVEVLSESTTPSSAHVLQQIGLSAAASTTQGHEEGVAVHSKGQKDMALYGAVRTEASEISNSNIQENATEKEVHPNIQHGIELWKRVWEYDQRMAEIPFTPVLSKKQKQKLKQAEVLGKLTYRTRSTGDASPVHNI